MKRIRTIKFVCSEHVGPSRRNGSRGLHLSLGTTSRQKKPQLAALKTSERTDGSNSVGFRHIVTARCGMRSDMGVGQRAFRLELQETVAQNMSVERAKRRTSSGTGRALISH